MKNCFHEAMIRVLYTNSEKLSQKMLQGYVGGQATMFHFATRDSSLGQIEKIDLCAGAVEVSCDWLAYKVPRGRIWRLDIRREPFIIVILKNGYVKYDQGEIKILGENGELTLTPRNHDQVIPKPEKIK